MSRRSPKPNREDFTNPTDPLIPSQPAGEAGPAPAPPAAPPLAQLRVRPHYDQRHWPLDPSVDLMTIPLPVALSRVEVELERMCQELDWVVEDLVPVEWEDYYPSSYPEDPTCGNLVYIQEILTRHIARLERMAGAMKRYAAAIDAAEGGGSPAGGAGQMAAAPVPTP